MIKVPQVDLVWEASLDKMDDQVLRELKVETDKWETLVLQDLASLETLDYQVALVYQEEMVSLEGQVLMVSLELLVGLELQEILVVLAFQVLMGDKVALDLVVLRESLEHPEEEVRDPLDSRDNLVPLEIMVGLVLMACLVAKAQMELREMQVIEALMVALEVVVAKV